MIGIHSENLGKQKAEQNWLQQVRKKYNFPLAKERLEGVNE